MMPASLLATSLLLTVIACQRAKEAEGPMERAGKRVDHATDRAKVGIEKAAAKTGSAVRAAGSALEKAASKLESAGTPTKSKSNERATP